MKRAIQNKAQLFLVFLSGIFAAQVMFKGSFLLCWVAYVPFFMLLDKGKAASKTLTSVVFSLGVSAVAFFWMIGSAVSFTANGLWYGFIITMISFSIFGIYWVLLSYIFSSLKNKSNSTWLGALLVASSFALGERLLMLLFGQMPYYLLSSGYPLLNHTLSIQWASLFGLSFLGFVVVFVNYLVAAFILSKQWTKLTWAVGIVVGVLAGGFLLKYQFEKKLVPQKEVKVAIAAENIPANLRWDESGGNILAQRLLTLNDQAAALKPAIVLWSETTIPWTYKPDDELLLQLLKTPYPKNTTHLIGFMSQYSEKKMYNSVYGITAAGKQVGRYDKKYLLDFVETPLFGLHMPFQDLDGYLIESGTSQQPIQAPAGKAGIVVCNEIVKSEATNLMVKNGAEFLLNLSNDGWFKHSDIVNLHFLYARLAAVVNRKDIVFNSNNGISGAVKANGEVLLKRKSDDFFVESVSIAPNRYDNLSKYFPNFILILALLLVLSVLLRHGYQRYKS